MLKKFFGMFFRHQVKIYWWFDNGFHMGGSAETFKVPYYLTNGEIIDTARESEKGKNFRHISKIERNGQEICKNT